MVRRVKALREREREGDEAMAAPFFPVTRLPKRERKRGRGWGRVGWLKRERERD